MGSSKNTPPDEVNQPLTLFKKITGASARFVEVHWGSVFFAAALSLILEHFGMLKLLTKFSILVVSSMAAQAPQQAVAIQSETTVVVVLGNDDFVSRYGERSPLDRCEMALDLGRILQKSPRRMAVDFDLSPILKPSDQERACQAQLDQTLAAHTGTLVLLAPFAVTSEPLLHVKHQWMMAQCQLGIHFADGELEQSLGMVTEHSVGHDPASLSRMAEQLSGKHPNYVCDQIAQATTPRENRWLNEDLRTGTKASAAPSGESEPLNLRALAKTVAVVDIGSAQFAELPQLSDNLVFFGGNWGRDDSFLTPIGTLAGVVIHAARLASIKDPVKPLPLIWAVWGDIVVGLCFAWVIGQFLPLYVAMKRRDLHYQHSSIRTSFSTLAMLTFVMAFGVLVLFFFLVADHLFSFKGIVIAPLVIALSMLIDGFISGPMDQLSELIEEEEEEEKKEKDRTPAVKTSDKKPISGPLLITVAALTAFGLMVVVAPATARLLAFFVFSGLNLLALALAVVLVFTRLPRFFKDLLQSLFRQGQHAEPLPDWRGIKLIGQFVFWTKYAIFMTVLAYGGWLLLPHGAH